MSLLRGEGERWHSFWTPIQLWITFLFVFTTCTPARAQPCKIIHDGQAVLCEKEGFDAVVKKCSDGLGSAAACTVKLDAALKSWDELKVRYDKCVVDSAPPSVTRPIMGYLAGLTGIAAVIVTPAIDTTTGVKVGVSLGGVGLIIAGLWSVLPQ